MSVKKAGKPANERMQFNILFWLVTAIFLVAIAVCRLLPPRLRWNVSGHDENKSIFEAARSAANSSIPYAFM
jgi:hypothetical protein